MGTMARVFIVGSHPKNHYALWWLRGLNSEMCDTCGGHLTENALYNTVYIAEKFQQAIK